MGTRLKRNNEIDLILLLSDIGLCIYIPAGCYSNYNIHLEIFKTAIYPSLKAAFCAAALKPPTILTVMSGLVGL